MAAAVRQWPFRVYSFPSEPGLEPLDIVIANTGYFEVGQLVTIYGEARLGGKSYRIVAIDNARRVIHFCDPQIRFRGVKFKGESAWHKQP